MMMKRMGRHPLYWILLLLFPAAVFVVPKLNETAETERIPVGYVMEAPVEWEEEIVREGESAKELFRYIRYGELEEMREDILTGELACGVCFDREFAEKLQMQDYHHCITLYVPEGMNVGGMVQEDLFRRAYRVYSAFWYAGLLEEQGYQVKSEEVLQKFSEYQDAGKVFAVNYEVLGENGGEVQNDSESGRETPLLSLRGILAFLTLLSALLGALESGRDRMKNLGKGIECPGRLSAAAAGAPILLAILFLTGGMVLYEMNVALNGLAKSGGGSSGILWAAFLQTQPLSELGSALLYGLVLWLSAMVIGRLVPVKLLEGAMHCFLLLVLLSCPVFFDIGETIPLVRHISRLFPITWYLNFWG